MEVKEQLHDIVLFLFAVVFFRSVQDMRLGGNCLFPLSHKDFSVTYFGTFHHSIEDSIGQRESHCLPLVQFFPVCKHLESITQSP